MNWFERYGIPGFYFVLLVAAFYYIIFGPPCDQDIILTALGIALSASLPIGYILVIFSQRLFYCDRFPWRVHSEAWKAAKNDADIGKEWWVEAEATILGRWKCSDKDKIEKGKWLQEWFAKRFDVLAINSALILATFLGWVLVDLVGLGLRVFQKPPLVDCCRTGILFLIACLSLLAVVVLIHSNRLLTKQAKHIATEYYKDLIKDLISTQTSKPQSH
jgi:hypothetical protein